VASVFSCTSHDWVLIEFQVMVGWTADQWCYPPVSKKTHTPASDQDSIRWDENLLSENPVLKKHGKSLSFAVTRRSSSMRSATIQTNKDRMSRTEPPDQERNDRAIGGADEAHRRTGARQSIGREMDLSVTQ
jgi:hypothetical protein